MTSAEESIDSRPQARRERATSWFERAVGLLAYSTAGAVASGLAVLAGFEWQSSAAEGRVLGSILLDPFAVSAFTGVVAVAAGWSWLWALVLVPKSSTFTNFMVVIGAVTCLLGVLAFTLPIRFVISVAWGLPPIAFAVLYWVKRKA